MTRPVTLCKLQSHDDEWHKAIWAEEAEEVLMLTEHGPDDDDGPGERLGAALELTQDGWATLVEMFALRHPARWQRIARKVRALREATR